MKQFIAVGKVCVIIMIFFLGGRGLCKIHKKYCMFDRILIVSVSHLLVLCL